MRTESLELISLMQKKTSNIRNICILAHVDHGKTTLADSLIASNGIISSRLAGKLRYMDSREDEQQRGITMKSSAISLYHMKDQQNYLINLIDSPGHIDFSSEVSTAVRLCDGAIVIVDVVEGVCPQTNAVLRQAWLEGIKPCLVINKMDRLITELKMTPLEAYHHLQNILQQVNAVTGNLFSAHVMEQSSKNGGDNKIISQNQDEQEVFDWSSGLDDVDDENLYFAPEQGNVVFASAIDGWAFRIDKFADMFSSKLGISKKILMKTLWGDYFLNAKAKKIFKGAYAKGKKPLFVQFVLENLWIMYEAVLNRDKPKVTKIIDSLNLKHTSGKFTEPKTQLQAILRQWLPLSPVVLDVVCSYLPSPCDVTEERAKNLMCSGFKKFETFPEETQKLKQDFLDCCSSDESPVIVFVSKMLSVEPSALPENKKRPLTREELSERYEAAKQRNAERHQQLGGSDEAQAAGGEVDKESGDNKEDIELSKQNKDDRDNDKEIFVAFARVFSGTLKKGSKLYVLGPKYDPSIKKVADGTRNDRLVSSSQLDGDSCSSTHAVVCEVKDLYLMMGREFETVDEVPAGNMVGINGFGDAILKSGTASTSLACPPFTAMTFEAKPIVRVAVEPKLPSQLPLLVTGMKLLNQADPCVEVMVQESGEHVIVAAGEVHLQRCLDDLKQRFAKIQIRVSEPIVPFRETIVLPPKVDMVNEEISGMNKKLAHHTQYLPAFMLKEIQAFSDIINKQEDADADNAEITLTKEELIELRKTTKLKSKTGVIEAYTADKQYCMCLHAKPLPTPVLECLEKNLELLKVVYRVSSEPSREDRQQVVNSLTEQTRQDIRELYKELGALFENGGKLWRGAIDKIWSIGPKGTFTNILLNNVVDYARPSVWSGLLQDQEEDGGSTSKEDIVVREYDNSIVSGFQLAAQAGPVCEEPMMGVCFIVNEWKKDVQLSNQDTASHRHGPLSGQHISSFREGCRRAVMAQPMRLMAAMYTCDVQATTEVLGKMYSVLNKREGRILSEDLKEGSDIFYIKAELPVAESFGFAEEIRKKTSGLASPQLVFNRWQVVDVDPFWIPTTEEEYELYGEKADSENQSLKYVNRVRKRKGLYIEEKTVEHAEKQRTLKRNK